MAVEVRRYRMAVEAVRGFSQTLREVTQGTSSHSAEISVSKAASQVNRVFGGKMAETRDGEKTFTLPFGIMEPPVTIFDNSEIVAASLLSTVYALRENYMEAGLQGAALDTVTEKIQKQVDDVYEGFVAGNGKRKKAQEQANALMQTATIVYTRKSSEIGRREYIAGTPMQKTIMEAAKKGSTNF